MPTIRRLCAPLIVMSGVIITAVAFAMPATAADGVYPPPGGTQVLGVSASVDTPVAAAPVAAAPVVVAGVSANAPTATGGELAFTGGAVVGLGALGGLLLIGGATMVVAGKRRKVDA